MMDVIMDADIANIFGKIDKIDLLKELFPKSRLFVCAAVRNELERAKLSGYTFVDNVLRHTTITEPTEKEAKMTQKIFSKRTIGKGETESIAIANNRKMLLLTNDRIAEKEAAKTGVETMNIAMLLRQLWKNSVISQEFVKTIISDMEEKCRIKIVNAEEIFKE